MTEGTNYLADLNHLVLEAAAAQEAFDNWDDGITFEAGSFGHGRICDLATLEQELNEANLTLIAYVAAHANEIIVAIGADPKEILV